MYQSFGQWPIPISRKSSGTKNIFNSFLFSRYRSDYYFSSQFLLGYKSLKEYPFIFKVWESKCIKVSDRD